MSKTTGEFKKLVEKELDKMIQKGDLSSSELKTALDAFCLLEKIGRVEYMDEYEEEEGSSGYYMPRYTPRGDMGYARRGSYGHDGYYDRGRSGHSIKDRMIDRLESMMDEAQTDYERQTIMKYIDSMRG